MSEYNSLYSLLLFISASISAVIMAITWSRRRTVQCAWPAAIFSFALMWWGLTYAFHWTKIYRPHEFFWVDATYLGVVIAPSAFFAFALCYKNQPKWLTSQRIILLFIEPIITLLLLWTDPYHGLFFAGKRVSASAVIYDGGFWFWFNTVYSYALLLFGFILMLHALLKSPRAYRGQVGMVLFGAAIPWVMNIIRMFGYSPFPNLDLTPFAFTLTGAALAYGMFYFRLLDLVPIARSVLVEGMSDGVIVLDIQDRIVDINPAAFKFIGVGSSVPIGEKIEVFIKNWPEILARCTQIGECWDEIYFEGKYNRPQYFDLQITKLYDHNSIISGRLISFQDVTRRKNVELQLRDANELLQKNLIDIELLQDELREQAIRDPLTELFNRRYLEETLERELAKAERSAGVVSVVMIDIDNFKLCNDRYGHKAGDKLLKEFGDLLKSSTRKGDVACRYGGDEFIVVLPGAPIPVAHERAEHWRLIFHRLKVPYKQSYLIAPISAGVACFPRDGGNADDLLQAADTALYWAKDNGGNLVASSVQMS